jgi:transcriptional regulator with XRE-family HTH domain
MSQQTLTAKIIGEHLQDARSQRGWKLERLAVELGVHPDTLARYERGDSEPSYRQVIHIAQLLDFPLDWFVGNGKRRR